MTREEFSKKLVECREAAGCGKNELCRRTGYTFNQLQRIENASNNYGISKPIIYLHQLSCYIEIKRELKSVIVTNTDNIASFIEMVKKEDNINQAEIAKKINITETALSNIMKNNNETTIDTFLKIINEFECTIEIKKTQ